MKFLVVSAFLVSLANAQQAQAPVTGQPSTQNPLQQPSPQQPLPQQPFPQQPPAGQGQQDSMRLRCQAENGTVPYWLDNTCRSYLSCTSYNLSMKTCDEGRAYSYPHRSCLAADQVNCSVQNEEFSAVIRGFLVPHLYRNVPHPKLPLVPFAASNGGALNGGQTAAGQDGQGAGGSVEEEEEEEGMTIDLDELPSIIVDMSNALNITLPAETCQRLDNQVKQLQTSINTALLMLVGCPERSCDVPLFLINDC